MPVLKPFPEQERNWVVARNVIIYRELEKILPALDRSGLKAIVLSGAALAATVYPDMSYRPMSDIDLLVKASDLSAVGKELASFDYKLEISRDNESHYRKQIHNFTLHVDVHTSLPYLSNSDLDDTMAQARQVKLNGIDALVLGPEDAIIYAGFDAVVGHARITQTVLSDIAMIICSQEIAAGKFDWPELIKRMKQYRLEAVLYFVLSEVIRQKYAVIPTEAFNAIKPVGKKSWELMLYRYLIKHRSDNDDVAPVLRALARPGRMGILSESFLPPADFMQRRYNVSPMISYVYYPFRFLSHLWRVSRLIFQVLRRAYLD
ncbi:MAG: nucleotidyltransferase family protein [Candidatus Brocadiia bacterium]